MSLFYIEIYLIKSEDKVLAGGYIWLANSMMFSGVMFSRSNCQSTHFGCIRCDDTVVISPFQRPQSLCTKDDYEIRQKTNCILIKSEYRLTGMERIFGSWDIVNWLYPTHTYSCILSGHLGEWKYMKKYGDIGWLNRHGIAWNYQKSKEKHIFDEDCDVI